MNGDVYSPKLRVYIRILNSFVRERPILSSNLKSDIKHLVAALQTIADAAENAEQEAIGDEGAKIWLESLQEVLYAMEDMMDELQLTIFRNVEVDSHRAPNQVSSSLSRFFNTTNSPPKSKVALSLQSLDKLTKDWILSASTPSVQKRRAGSFQVRGLEYEDIVQDPEEIIGRRGDEKEVINLILKSAHRVSVVPIVGFIGIGKTTLARLIYCNRRLYNDHFDRKLWLGVGDCREQFDFWTILRDGLIRKDFLNDDDRSVNQMKMELGKLLENKCFFIVLDGFKDSNLHKSLARELIDMLSKGSAILLTTRSRRDASLIATSPAYQLQPLSSDASNQLFAQLALTRSMERVPEYKRIGGEFVKLCSGVPLLLRRVTSHLIDMSDPAEWAGYLKDIQDNKQDIMLYDAFVEIPSHLNLPIQCLRLQKTCGLGVEPLLCVWIALGLSLYPSDDTTQPPEYIARKYLKEVVDSALFPDVEYAPGGVVRHIRLNDALCDFTTAGGHQSWVTVRDDSVSHGSPVYMIWDQDCLRGDRMPSDCTRDPNKVRLFMISTMQRASVQFMRDTVSCFQRLRVLGVGGCDVEMLPDSIGQLIHLRYLDAGRNPRMESLPDSICNLWFLQTLYLHGCFKLQNLPADIGRLQNLRCLTLTILQESLPEAVGQLTSLRTLGLTGCPSLSSLPNTIKNLKNLNTLAIVLGIYYILL